MKSLAPNHLWMLFQLLLLLGPNAQDPLTLSACTCTPPASLQHLGTDLRLPKPTLPVCMESGECLGICILLGPLLINNQ